MFQEIIDFEATIVWGAAHFEFVWKRDAEYNDRKSCYQWNVQKEG
jgi:hypothetical protein